MSGVKVIRTLLTGDSGIGALVGDRIRAGVLPQGGALPAVAITEVSAVESRKVRQAGPVLMTSRIQVSAVAKDYPTQKALLAAVTNAINGQNGMIAGVKVECILRDVVGPDQSDDDARLFLQTRDFIVKFIEQH